MSLTIDAGVNIFYHFTRKESLERHPDYGYPAHLTPPSPRYNPTDEVGRSRQTSEKIGSRITDHGNWIKMEEKGYLEQEIKKAGLDLDRVIYVRDWDDVKGYTENYFSGGEITEITSGGRGGIVHTSPIRWSGSDNRLELICGFLFYSITDNGKLQRDQFTARAGTSSYGGQFVTNIEHQRATRGSGNGLVRVTSKAVDRLLKKDHFEREIWELYERFLRGK